MNNNNIFIENFANCSPQSLSDAFILACIEGDADALKLFIALHCLSETFEKMKENNEFSECVEREFQRNAHRNEYRAFGVAVSRGSVTQYDYKACNDPYLREIEAKARDLQAKIKARKDFLKALNGETADALSEGEMICPPDRVTKSVLRITRSK